MDGNTTGARTSTPIFEDGFGKRYELPSTGGAPLSVLALGNAFVALPNVAELLNEQLTKLARFQHPGFARAHRVARVANSDRGIALVSDQPRGERLSTLLVAARQDGYRLETSGALWVTCELMSALAALHERVPGVFHAAIAAERLIVTPEGRLVVVEHALGPCVARLAWTREQYWRTLRVTLPREDQPFTRATDVTQVGMLAIALLQGRPVGDPAAAAAAIKGLPSALQSWLLRTLQLDQQMRFESAVEAQTALNQAVSDAEYVAGLSVVKDLFSAYAPSRSQAKPMAPVTPVPLPQPEPAPKAGAMVTAAVVEPAQIPRAADATAPEQIPAAVAAEVTSEPESEPVSVAAPRAAVTISEPPPARPTLFEPRLHQEESFDERQSKRELVLALLKRIEWAPWKIAAAAAGLVLLATATTYAARHYLKGSTPAALAQVETVRQLPPMTTLPEPIPAAAPAEVVIARPDPLQALIASPEPAPAAAPAPPIAWIAIRAPQEVEVYEDGRVIGTSQAERIPLSPGRHQIELVNTSLGVRVRRDVRVTAGRVAAVSLDWPDGTLALNALPWANVAIDGQPVGETPLANITVPVGPHEVVFRHPELGERRQVVTVTTTPQRVSVDLRGTQP